MCSGYTRQNLTESNLIESNLWHSLEGLSLYMILHLLRCYRGNQHKVLASTDNHSRYLVTLTIFPVELLSSRTFSDLTLFLSLRDSVAEKSVMQWLGTNLFLVSVRWWQKGFAQSILQHHRITNLQFKIWRSYYPGQGKSLMSQGTVLLCDTYRCSTNSISNTPMSL